MALYAILAPFAGILFFLLTPVLIVAAGGALGDELIRRHARFAAVKLGRNWRLIHQIGATAAALCVLLVVLRYLSDGGPAGVSAWLLAPSLTSLGYLPHALASWFQQQRQGGTGNRDLAEIQP